ncbi:unnamed protein product [Sympodiomycopsis kandeliae]
MTDTIATQDTNLLRVLLIRHGETDHNVAGIIQGQMDTPLNALGRIQASLVGKALSHEVIDEIYSSPLTRAHDTAKAIYNNQTTVTKLFADDRLKERAFGSLEGKSFKGEKTDTIDGIEKSNDLSFRLAHFWNDLIEAVKRGHSLDGTPSMPPQTKQGRTTFFRTVAIVGHGAALSSLLNVLSNYSTLARGVQPSRLWNCSITEIVVGIESSSEQEWEDIPEGNGAGPSVAQKVNFKQWQIKPPHLIGDRSNVSQQTQHSSTKDSRQDVYPILINRWADVRHLSTDEAEASVGNGGTAIHKPANADEIVVEERDEKKA